MREQRVSLKMKPPLTLLVGGGVFQDRLRTSLLLNGFEVELGPSFINHFDFEELHEIFKNFANKGRRQSDSLWVHLGVSDWAIRPEMPQLSRGLGLEIMTPPTRTLNFFSNQLTFLAHASDLQIPILAKNLSPIQTLSELKSTLVAETEFAVLKSIHGRGRGRGVRVFNFKEAPDLLDEKFHHWRQELQLQFEDDLFFVESYLSEARRIIVPFARPHRDEIQLFPFVESSLSSLQREVIEFSPSSELDEEVTENIKIFTKKLLNTFHIIGVGELEYLVDEKKVYLISGTAGLTHRFPLIEETSEQSLVYWQLASMGVVGETPELAVPFLKSEKKKVAILVHVYAEDPMNGLPRPGKIQSYETNAYKGIGFEPQWFSRYYEGLTISDQADPLVGHFFNVSRNYSEALKSAQNLLKNFWIAGEISTNLHFLCDLMEHPRVKAGMIHCGFLDEEFIPVYPHCEYYSGLIQSIASKELVSDQESKIGINFGFFENELKFPFEWVRKTIFIDNGERGLDGEIKVTDESLIPEGFNSLVKVCFYPLRSGYWRAHINQRSYVVKDIVPLIEGHEKKKSLMELRSLVRGEVHSIFYRSGSEVEKHKILLFVKSMKRLIPHSVSFSVKIESIEVESEQRVHEGALLMKLDNV